MLTKRIIPCLDVKNGYVVKGVKFRNHEIVGSILDLASKYNEDGADELVFYDIGASRGRLVCGVPIQWNLRQHLSPHHTIGLRGSVCTLLLCIPFHRPAFCFAKCGRRIRLDENDGWNRTCYLLGNVPTP